MRTAPSRILQTILLLAPLAVVPRLPAIAATKTTTKAVPRLRDLTDLADQCNSAGSIQLRASRTFINQNAVLATSCKLILDAGIRLTLVNVRLATRGLSITRSGKPVPGPGTEVLFQNVTVIGTEQDAIGIDLAGPNDSIRVMVATIDAGQSVSLIAGGTNLPGSGGTVDLSNVTLRADRSPAGTVTVRAGTTRGGRIKAELVNVSAPGGSQLAAENCAYTFVVGVDRTRLC